ncbi:HAMP domain-containing protein [Brevundimonas sp. LF-1]|uniref:HAMP domain-containing protein n=1 Tax=Brevundimonas sp. LF-1 TaxID=3126100 RepID=UPI0030DE8C52
MLQNLSVPKKLILSFMAVIGACGTATLIVLWCVVSLQRADAADLTSREVMKASDRLLAAAVEQQNAMRGYVANRDPAFIEVFDTSGADVKARMADLAASDVEGAYVAEQTALIAAAAAFEKSAAEIMALARDPAADRAAQSQAAAGATLTDIRQAVGAIQTREAAQAQARAEAKSAAFVQAYVSFAIGGVLALAIAVAAALWLIGALSRPVEAMTRAMGRLAGGDLNVAIPAMGRRDEIGRMADAVLTFKQNAEEKARLEAEAEAARVVAEAEQQAQAARDAEAARQQAQVVEGVARGWSACRAASWPSVCTTRSRRNMKACAPTSTPRWIGCRA